jgi:hypothetical protein
MELLILLVCLLVVGFFVYRFIRKVRAESRRSDIGIPPGLQGVLYASSHSSGRSLKSWRTRWGAAKNCLKIVVTEDFLYTSVPDPLLRTITRKYDLEHQIHKSSIETITPKRRLLSRRSYIIAYRDGRGEAHRIELWPRNRKEFERVLGGNVEKHL